jgi:hypothetical protein
MFTSGGMRERALASRFSASSVQNFAGGQHEDADLL